MSAAKKKTFAKPAAVAAKPEPEMSKAEAADQGSIELVLPCNYRRRGHVFMAGETIMVTQAELDATPELSASLEAAKPPSPIKELSTGKKIAAVEGVAVE